MPNGAVVSVILAIIGISGTLYTAYKASTTTLAKTNYENATALYEQYKSLNDDLRKDLKEESSRNEETKKELQNQINELQKEITKMKNEFKERENFLEREIELRDDRIEELEIIIVQKDGIIATLKGEI